MRRRKEGQRAEDRFSSKKLYDEAIKRCTRNMNYKLFVIPRI
jgi:hypothetical protein